MEQKLKLTNIFTSYKYEVHQFFYALRNSYFIHYFVLTILSFAPILISIGNILDKQPVNILYLSIGIILSITFSIKLLQSNKKLKTKITLEIQDTFPNFNDRNYFTWGHSYVTLKRIKLLALLKQYSIKKIELLLQYAEKEKERRNSISNNLAPIRASIHILFIGIFIAIVFAWIQSKGEKEIFEALPILFRLNSTLYLLSFFTITGGFYYYYKTRNFAIDDFIEELEQLNYENQFLSGDDDNSGQG